MIRVVFFLTFLRRGAVALTLSHQQGRTLSDDKILNYGSQLSIAIFVSRHLHAGGILSLFEPHTFSHEMPRSCLRGLCESLGAACRLVYILLSPLALASPESFRLLLLCTVALERVSRPGIAMCLCRRCDTDNYAGAPRGVSVLIRYCVTLCRFRKRACWPL